jgi:uncharacterized repeat protein (TIGR01451 family)
MSRSHRRRPIAGLARFLVQVAGAVALALSPAILFGPPGADASNAIRAFTPRFSVTDQGAITLIGNTLGTCQAGATYNGSTCAQAQAGTATPALNNNNNNWSMVYVDLDGDSSTINSSSATLTLPPGSTVLFAELTWAGYSTSGQRGVAKFKVPGGSYIDVSATRVDANGSNYSAIADVTPLVASLGDPSGTYWGANVQSTSGATDRYAAWALIIVYENLTLPLRNLVVFDGYAVVNNTNPVSINTTVSGFLTPASGTVQTKIGAVAYEGDIGYVNDTMQLNGVTLSNALNPADNFFNSSVTIDGTRFSAKNPDYVNQMAFDADIVDASGILANSATSATITYTTNTGSDYDTYYPTVVTFQTDVFTPVVDVVKSSEDLTHSDAIYNGDTIRYTLTATSTGNDPATFVVLTDPIPNGLTYVPGSAYILTGPNSDPFNPKTDALGDDQVDFANGAITFRLGVGADATMGGQMAAGVSSTVQFDCTVNSVPAGTHLINQAYVSYSGLTLGGGYATSSDSSTVSAGDNPDNQVTNAPPVAIPDTYVVLRNTATALSVLDNDWDPDGNIDPSSVTIVSGPSHGSITSIDPVTGAVTYNPTTGYTGADSFTYQVCDSAIPAQCSQAGVSITVRTTLLTPPTARPDGASTNEGTQVVIDVRANDSQGSGTSWSSETVIVPAAFGTTSVNASNGQITYTPTGYYYGPDSFIYQICDNNGLCDTALVSIDVLRVDHAPTANNDTATVTENSAVVITVLANDTDPENNIDVSSVTVQSGPSHGSTSTNSSGTVTYTPTTGYYGSDSFTYTVCDTTSPTPLCSGTATVSITVNQAAPAAADDSYDVHKNVALSVAAPGVLGNDSDPNGLTLHPVLGTDVSHGVLVLNADGSFTYTPTSGYTGPDSFTYQACTPAPGSLCSATVTVSLTVANDPPSATDDSYSVAENGSLSITAPGVLGNDSDPNGDGLSASVVSTVSHGSLSLNANGSFTYTPTTGYYGSDSFTYQACDTQAACDSATVDITVSAGGPSANPDSYDVHKNVALSVAAPGVLGNDSDPNGLTLHPVLGTDVSHGVLVLNADGSFTYTPTSGYTGPDSFTYQACTPAPGSLCSATVTVSLTVANDPPSATDDSYSVAENGSLSITAPGVLGNDSDPNGDGLSASVVSTVSHGSLSLNANGSFTYTPTTGYYGSDSFTYQACDTQAACDSATVDITVNPLASSPVATDDTAYAVPGTPVTISVLTNDTVGTGSWDLSSLQVTSGPSHGSTVVNPDGTIAYSTAGGFASDSFVYRICNTVPACDSATVTVTIDLAPTFGAGVDGSTISFAVGDSLPGALSFSDPDLGDTATLSVSGTLPAGLTLNPDGTWSGSTDGATPGDYPLSLQACDQHGLCTGASIVLSVRAADATNPPTNPPAPTASPSSGSTPPPTASSQTGSAMPGGTTWLLLVGLLSAIAGMMFTWATKERRLHAVRRAGSAGYRRPGGR